MCMKGGRIIMTRPLVSVIIPTYNRPAILCELMEALFRQTFEDFEVIVINDCGDNVDFIKELYPELAISVYNMETNIKTRTRNEGLLHARGEFIMLCDDDDLLTPDHMRTMIDNIEGC